MSKEPTTDFSPEHMPSLEVLPGDHGSFSIYVNQEHSIRFTPNDRDKVRGLIATLTEMDARMDERQRVSDEVNDAIVARLGGKTVEQRLESLSMCQFYSFWNEMQDALQEAAREIRRLKEDANGK